MTAGAKADPAGIVVAVLLAVTAGVVAFDASRVELGQTYGLGPKAMPYVVAGGLALLAVGNLVLGLRGDFPPRQSMDFKATLLILGGLAVLIATIGLGGGFIPATTILFAATATAFGRRAPHVDLAIGFALAVMIYLVFDKVLGLSLPAGPLELLL